MKNNHSLTILWAVIICGASFLIANKYKTANAPSPPENQIEININDNKQPGDLNELIVENSDNTNLLNNKTEQTLKEETGLLNNKTEQTIQTNTGRSYAEHLREGDRLANNFYYKSAINQYNEAILKNPSSVEAMKKLAETYLKDNTPEKAEEVFKKAIRTNSSSIELKLGIARSLLNQGKTEEAKIIIWDLPIENTQVRYYQALTLIIYDKTEEALQIFEDLNKNENLESSLKEKVGIFIKTNESINIFAKDDLLFARLKMIFALVQAEEYAPAIPKVFTLINEKNNYRDAWIILGYAYLKSGKINDSIDAFIQARELDTNKAETMFYLGIAYFINNEFEKSIYYLQKAQSLNFQPKDLLDLKMAEVYKARNDFEKSEEKYESLIRDGNKDVFVYENLINLNLEKLNNPKKAFQYAEELFKKYPDNAISNLSLAKIYLETNNLKHAKEFINKALSIDQSIAEIYFIMGKISEKEKKQTMAKEYYQMATTLSQNEETTKKSIDRINIINASISNKQYQVNLFQQ